MDTAVDDSNRNLNSLLDSYPRERFPLSEQHQQVYVSHYLENREGQSVLTRLKNSMEAWMHRQTALHQHGNEVLELGAGTLNHLQYEPAHLSYDAIEPFQELWQGSSRLQRVRTMYPSITDVPMQPKYHRVISIAVLEHLTDLPRVVAETALRLRPDGLFQAGIPSEGGFLWGLGWRLSTAVAFRARTGLPYAEIMRHEHVNTANEIITICRWLFANVNVRRFPLGLHHLSFYTVIEADNPNVGRCCNLLKDGMK